MGFVCQSQFTTVTAATLKCTLVTNILADKSIKVLGSLLATRQSVGKTAREVFRVFACACLGEPL